MNTKCKKQRLIIEKTKLIEHEKCTPKPRSLKALRDLIVDEPNHESSQVYDSCDLRKIEEYS